LIFLQTAGKKPFCGLFVQTSLEIVLKLKRGAIDMMSGWSRGWRVVAVVLAVGWLMAVPVSLLAGDADAGVGVFDRLELKIAEAQRDLAGLLQNKGAYDEAERVLLEGLEANPGSLPLLIEYSYLCKRQYRLAKMEELLGRAEGVAPGHWEVLLAQARVALLKMDFAGARVLLEKLEAGGEAPMEVLYERAYLLYLENKQDEVVALLKRGIADYPKEGLFYYLLSQVERSRKQYAAWKGDIERAVELDPLDASIRAAYAFMMVKMNGDMKGAEEQAKIALRIDPFCLTAHSYLGNGGRSEQYPAAEKKEKSEKDEIDEWLAEADKLLVKREFDRAEPLFGKVLERDSSSMEAIIGMGTIHYYREQYDEALRWFFKGLEVSPGHGMAHYGVQQALSRKLDGVNVHLPSILKRFDERDVEAPEFLVDVFVNYRDLAPDMQKIIRMMVAPLSNYMKTLKMAGATFYFLPFHHFLWQAPGLKSVKGTRTFDLRLWDDVKGQGGFHAVSGTEWQRGVKSGRFNVALHEFAHQVHSFLSGEEKREVKRLFIKAKKEGRTLDYYADMNEFEYLAQGLEAYASLEKLPDQKDTMGHTRAELLKKDPALYAFVEGMNKKKSYRENEILAIVSSAYGKVGDKKYDEALEILKRGEVEYVSHPAFYRAQANIFFLKGQPEMARSIYQNGLRQFPGSLELAVDVAMDDFFLGNKRDRAVAALEAQAKKHPEASELYSQLGQFYYYNGEFAKMEKTFKRALALDPYPNPYSGYRPYFYLGAGSLERGNYKGAIRHFTHRLEQIDRNDPLANGSLALAYLESGDQKKGQAHLDMAVKLNGRLPFVQEVKARFLLKEGKGDKAKKILEWVVKHYPKRLESRVLLARLLKETDPAAAKALLQEGIRLAQSLEAMAEVVLGQDDNQYNLFSRPALAQLRKELASLDQ
jgi:predicted Zn-dependent protease